MIEPTVGRVVWFWPNGWASTTFGGTTEINDPKQPFKADVTFVHNDREINVAGYDHPGHAFRCTDVILLQDDDAKPEWGTPFCSWMSFQKAQAKAQEAAAKAAK